jgi:hypothetical protein
MDGRGDRGLLDVYYHERSEVVGPVGLEPTTNRL